MTHEDLEEDDWLWRPQPPGPYRLPGAVLTLPGKVLEHTLTVFRKTAARQVEACCFWYGVRADGGSATVLSVVVPKQRNTRGNYFVPAAAVAEMAAATRPRGWVNLAQVHTHPGRGVEHSRYDDEHANSRRALSAVFPFYGRWQGPWPVGVGVHEFQDDYWHLLPEADAALRVVVADPGDAELLDLR
jgi:hypothetical protein